MSLYLPWNHITVHTLGVAYYDKFIHFQRVCDSDFCMSTLLNVYIMFLKQKYHIFTIPSLMNANFLQQGWSNSNEMQLLGRTDRIDDALMRTGRFRWQ